MNIAVNLGVGVRQSLTISREMVQAVEILQYDREELAAFLREQVEKNPLLRMKDRAEAAPGQGLGERWRRDSGDRAFANGAAGDAPDIASSIGEEVTLSAHLYLQLALVKCAPEVRVRAGQVIDSLEEDGYLRQDSVKLAELLGCSQDEMDAAIALVQTFDPAGVCARNLAECLQLQLREQGELRPAMAALLTHTDLIVKGEVKRLAAICGVSESEVRVMLRKLRSLDPAPGRALDCTPVCPALPDVLVDLTPTGALKVELNPDLIPKLLLDRSYHAEVSSQICEKDEKSYLDECMRSGALLMRNLDRRFTTMLRICREIVRRQEAYFRHGLSHLRPLTQGEIAQELGIHESTVSRATANKYILCSRGLLPVKFFFSEALGGTGTDGLGHASETIRRRIREVVEGETPEKILSDDVIAALLHGEGIDIARRTVAKYRSQLKIPSSADRRRLARLECA